MRVTMVAPGPSWRPNWMAAITLAPEEVPANMASSRARRRVISFASSVGTGSTPQRWRVADAHAFDVVRARLPAAQYGRLRRLHRVEFYVALVALQRLDGAARRRARSHAVHERTHFTARLLPDFIPERVITADRVPVVELVGPARTRRLGKLRAVSIMSRMGFFVVRPPSLGTSGTRAPSAAICRRFSLLNASDVTM